MALKATVEPMLIKESSVVKRNVSKTELRGIFQPGFTWSSQDKLAKLKSLITDLQTLTCEMNEENGNPLSRAKDHVCRDTVACVLITDDVIVTMRIAVMTDAPAWLLVPL
jgi:hypothetical protein